MEEKAEKISNVEVEKGKQPGKGGEREYPIPDYEGIDPDKTFLKIAALFRCCREIMRANEDHGVPLSKHEQYGLEYLAEGVLGDLELLIYGERMWMDWLDPKTKEGGNDK